MPNGSFEDKISCPSTGGQLSLAEGWFNPDAASPDYFNVCGIPYITPWDTTYVVNIPENVFGYQDAKTGMAYAGFY